MDSSIHRLSVVSKVAAASIPGRIFRVSSCDRSAIGTPSCASRTNAEAMSSSKSLRGVAAVGHGLLRRGMYSASCFKSTTRAHRPAVERQRAWNGERTAVVCDGSVDPASGSVPEDTPGLPGGGHTAVWIGDAKLASSAAPDSNSNTGSRRKACHSTKHCWRPKSTTRRWLRRALHRALANAIHVSREHRSRCPPNGGDGASASCSHGAKSMIYIARRRVGSTHPPASVEGRLGIATSSVPDAA
mmetsp:Transcript_2395/g.7455  ORF Transcript_2395/g.7455 Transcript_2395/m.7455 type:complete len:244 (-) Transcript_2395:51-782(-)